jgi:hypothetical protein
MRVDHQYNEECSIAKAGAVPVSFSLNTRYKILQPDAGPLG